MSAIARRRRRDRLVQLSLVAPSLIFLLAIFVVPVVQAVLLAFQGDGGGFTLANAERAQADLRFWPAIRNTMILVAITVPLQVALALGLTMLLTKIVKFRSTVLYFWAIPLAISDLAAGIIWLTIFTQSGYLNDLLMGLGLVDEPVLFLAFGNTAYLFTAIIVAEIWRATAIVLIILVAGVQLIPKEYGEAAEVLGANAWTRFWRITLPLLKPSLQTALILRTILAFEAFAVVSALVGISNLEVLAGEAWRWSTMLRNEGVASFYALIILAISIVTTVAYLVLLRSRHSEQLR